MDTDHYLGFGCFRAFVQGFVLPILQVDRHFLQKTKIKFIILVEGKLSIDVHVRLPQHGHKLRIKKSGTSKWCDFFKKKFEFQFGCTVTLMC